MQQKENKLIKKTYDLRTELQVEMGSLDLECRRHQLLPFSRHFFINKRIQVSISPLNPFSFFCFFSRAFSIKYLDDVYKITKLRFYYGF